MPPAQLAGMRLPAICLLVGALAAGAARGEPEPPDRPDPSRLEVAALPAIAYDSDLGLTLGALVAVAQFDPARAPYRWRLEFLLSTTVKHEADGGYAFPYHDDYVKIDLPGLLDDRLRLGAEAHWGRYADSAWYGVGDASSNQLPPGAGARYFNYQRTYPRLEVSSRWLLWKDAGAAAPGQKLPRIELIAGASLLYEDLDVAPDSSLAHDVALAAGTGPDAETMRGLLHGVGDHFFAVAKVGVAADTRDSEMNPTHGVTVELSLRAAPAPGDARYVGFYAASTGFLPLFRDNLILAGHAVLDAMAGDAPYFALTQAGAVGPTTAIGGGSSVRGVPGQRYGGQIKAFANFELRAQLPAFTIGGSRFRVGAVALADLGRVWAGFTSAVLDGHDVDGSGHVATGVGGGLRIVWGETLVIRADYAVSPSDGSDGLYIDIGHAF